MIKWQAQAQDASIIRINALSNLGSLVAKRICLLDSWLNFEQAAKCCDTAQCYYGALYRYARGGANAD